MSKYINVKEYLIKKLGESEYYLFRNWVNSVDDSFDGIVRNNVEFIKWDSIENINKKLLLKVYNMFYKNYRDNFMDKVFNEYDIDLIHSSIVIENNYNYFQEKRDKLRDETINMTYEEQKELLGLYGWRIKYIENPSEELQLIAIKEHPYSIEYIKNPSDEIKIIAIKRNARCIEYMDNLTDEMKLLAVKRVGTTIKHIENPSEELQLIAINQNPHSIKHIENPSEELVELAEEKIRKMKLIKILKK